MHEEIVTFGAEGSSLVGIYTKTNIKHAGPRPTLLFWNVGVSHRVGPQRHFVDLARRMRGFGFNSFRFDLGGLGDSLAASSGRSRHEQEIVDVISALDALESTYGPAPFILVGFCSGAATAHPVAVKDPRIAGLIMIDGYGYSTVEHRLLHTLDRMFSPKNILSRARRISKALVQSDNNADAGYFLNFPPRTRVEAEIATMAAKGLRFLYIFSGGVQIYYNHENQFWRMFPQLKSFQSQIAVRYFPQANHLFMYHDNRSQLFDCLQNWLVDQFALTQGTASGTATREYH